MNARDPLLPLQPDEAAAIGAFAAQTWDDEIVPALTDYIAIPAKSPMFDADWQKNGYIERVVRDAASWVEGKKIAGLTLEDTLLPAPRACLGMPRPVRLLASKVGWTGFSRVEAALMVWAKLPSFSRDTDAGAPAMVTLALPLPNTTGSRTDRVLLAGTTREGRSGFDTPAPYNVTVLALLPADATRRSTAVRVVAGTPPLPATTKARTPGLIGPLAVLVPLIVDATTLTSAGAKPCPVAVPPGWVRYQPSTATATSVLPAALTTATRPLAGNGTVIVLVTVSLGMAVSIGVGGFVVPSGYIVTAEDRLDPEVLTRRSTAVAPLTGTPPRPATWTRTGLLATSFAFGRLSPERLSAMRT